MHKEELVAFVVLAERQHVTSAAAELHVTPSALSRMLSRVEREVGAPLFDREGRRLKLNHNGRIFEQHARRAIAELDTAKSRIAELTDPEGGQLRLAYLYWLGPWMVPELLGLFRRERPSVRFALRSGTTEGVVELLERGDVEFILTTERPAMPQMAWQLVRRERLYLAVPANHPLRHRETVSVAELACEDFVLPVPGSEIRMITDELFAACGFEPRVVIESYELTAIRAFVSAGSGVSILPPWHTWHAGPSNHCYIPLSDVQAYRDVVLAWWGDRPQSSIAARFRTFVHELRNVTPEWILAEVSRLPNPEVIEPFGGFAAPISELLDLSRPEVL